MRRLPKLALEKLFHSVKSLIVWVFIPIVAVIAITVGIVSYVLIHRQLADHAYINIADTVSQTKSYLDNRLYDLFEQLAYLTEDSDVLSVLSRVGNDQQWRLKDLDYVRLAENINKVYTAYYSSLKSMLLYLNDGRILLYKTDSLFAGVDFSFGEWRRRFQGNPSDYYWLNLHQDRLFKGEDARVVSLFKLLGREDTPARGIILFNLRESFFRKILENPVISPNGYLALVSADGAMAFKTVDRRYRLDGGMLDRIRKLEGPAGNFTYQKPFGPKMVVIYDTISACQWKLVAVLPENEILSKADYIKPLIWLLIAILLAVAAVMFYVLATIITKPLSRLTRKVQAVTEGDMDIPFDIKASNEIGILNDGIGQLMVRIKTLLAQIKEEQEKKRIADLTVLQAQIHPHFLYNTLYSIQQLCALGESENAARMLLALGNFFRIGLSHGQEIITLREEIDHVQNYLVIQQMKYADRLLFKIEVEEEALEARILKLTLQPLVENAIYHGVKLKPDQGIVRIRGYREGPLIRIEVRDNGVGMSAAQLAKVREGLAPGTETGPGSGFGLRNVHQRLQIHFGADCGLAIDSREGAGTVVTVAIPAPPEDLPLKADGD